MPSDFSAALDGGAVTGLDRARRLRPGRTLVYRAPVKELRAQARSDHFPRRMRETADALGPAFEAHALRLPVARGGRGRSILSSVVCDLWPAGTVRTARWVRADGPGTRGGQVVAGWMADGRGS